MSKNIIKFTAQEFFEFAGENLSSILPKSPHSNQSTIFINIVCKEIDRYIRKRDVGLYRENYDMSEFQIDTIKEACLNHALDRIQNGKVYIDSAGLPKELPLSETTKDILNQIIYRGV